MTPKCLVMFMFISINRCYTHPELEKLLFSGNDSDYRESWLLRISDGSVLLRTQTFVLPWKRLEKYGRRWNRRNVRARRKYKGL